MVVTPVDFEQMCAWLQGPEARSVSMVSGCTWGSDDEQTTSVPDMQAAPTLAVQELPTRRLQNVLSPPRLGGSPRCAQATPGSGSCCWVR